MTHPTPDIRLDRLAVARYWFAISSSPERGGNPMPLPMTAEGLMACDKDH